MTQQQLIEKIMRKFHDRKEGEMRAELNEVQKEF